MKGPYCDHTVNEVESLLNKMKYDSLIEMQYNYKEASIDLLFPLQPDHVMFRNVLHAERYGG